MVVNDKRPISLTNYFVDGEPGAAIKSTTTSGSANMPPDTPTANASPEASTAGIKEECEEKLAVLIQTVKAELEAEKEIRKQETPSEMMMQ